jgi:hypothetical protein
MDKRTSLFTVGVTDEEIIFYNFDTRWRRVATASPRRKSATRRPPSGENLIKYFWAVVKKPLLGEVTGVQMTGVENNRGIKFPSLQGFQNRVWGFVARKLHKLDMKLLKYFVVRLG